MTRIPALAMTCMAGGRALMRALLPAALAAALLFLVPTLAYADATFTVDRTDDVAAANACLDAVPNDCSLRGAITKANGAAGTDTIILPIGIYRLTLSGADNANATGDLDITDHLNIIGSGGNQDGTASQTVIQSGSNDVAPGSGIDTIMSINPTWNKVINVSIKAVTLRYGKNTDDVASYHYGGAIDFEATPYDNAALPGIGSLTIYNSVLTYNSSTQTDGGAISVLNSLNRAGTALTIINSEISNNTTTRGYGGAFATGAAFSISGTSIKNNSSVSSSGSGGFGGGIYATMGGTITNSTISGNTVSPAPVGRGAGLVITGGLTMTNVTLSGNTGAGQGGAMWVNGSANALTNLTVTGNSATDGGGIYWGASGTITMNNSIVWGNSNFGAVSGSNNLIGIDPKFDGGLKDNGGKVFTYALLPTSPAIDAGSNAAATAAGATNDGRGAPFARIVDADGNGTAIVDIGAFEVQSADVTVTVGAPGTLQEGQTNAQYSIIVTNIGTSPTTGTASVVLDVPAALTNRQLSGTGWTCNAGTLVCTRSDALAGTASYPTITLTVDVAADAPNSVTVEASVALPTESNAANNTDAETTTVKQKTTTAASAVTTTYGSTTSVSATVTTGVAGTVTFSASGLGNIGTATVNTATGVAATPIVMAFAPANYTLTATFMPSDTNTYLTSSGTASFTLNKATLTVTAENKSRTYGAANPTLTASYSGFVFGQDSTYLGGALSLTTAATTTSVPNSYAITVGGHTSANYDITFVPGTLTVSPAALTVKANNQNRTYGTANAALTVTVTGFVLGETEANLGGVLSVSTPATASSVPGTYAITPSGYTSANYTITNEPGTLTVAKATLNVTVDAQSRNYGAANPAFTVSYSGFVLAQTESVLGGTLSLSTTATATSPAATYTITASGQTSANYDIVYAPGTLTVTPAPLSVKVDDASRLYGDANPAFTFTPTGLMNGETAAVLTGTPVYTTAAVPTSAPAAYPVTLTGLASTNYTITYQPGSLTVNLRPLTVTAEAKSKPYGDDNPTLTVTYSGFATDEDQSDLGGSLSLTTTATAASTVGTYPITASGYTSTNYVITYTPALLTVTPAPL
ncbi:MAG: hypothetical protein K0R39_3094, partial [Symbiobacteriaceae bacterium]|nr:hypothetical protein [Symbiobacteriaceae bacterium]